jgi:hypothetical protein
MTTILAEKDYAHLRCALEMPSDTHRGLAAHDYATPHRRHHFFLFSRLAPQLTVMFGLLALA